MNNAPTPEGIVFACFFGTWAALGIACICLLHLGKNVAFKRKWFPRFVIFMGVLFVSFLIAMFAPSSGMPEILGMLAFMVPMTSLISYWNIKMTKFCDKCGHTIYNRAWFNRMKFCPNCGAGLDAKPKPDRDPLE